MTDAIADGKPHINLSFSEHKAIKHWVNHVECFASNESSGRELCESYAVSANFTIISYRILITINKSYYMSISK